jgi:hypothetical protein
MAALKDLGIGGGANGFLFWGLIKQAPRAGDPIAAFERVWERYRERANVAVETAKTDDVRARVKDAIARRTGAFAKITQVL